MSCLFLSSTNPSFSIFNFNFPLPYLPISHSFSVYIKISPEIFFLISVSFHCPRSTKTVDVSPSESKKDIFSFISSASLVRKKSEDGSEERGKAERRKPLLCLHLAATGTH